jgi:hypothetical protein
MGNRWTAGARRCIEGALLLGWAVLLWMLVGTTPAHADDEGVQVGIGHEAASASTSKPVKPEVVKPEPVKPEPVKPEPVKPEPVKPEVVVPEPVKPEPVKVEAEPVEPGPVELGPVELGAVQPESAGSEPGEPSAQLVEQVAEDVVEPTVGKASDAVRRIAEEAPVIEPVVGTVADAAERTVDVSTDSVVEAVGDVESALPSTPVDTLVNEVTESAGQAGDAVDGAPIDQDIDTSGAVLSASDGDVGQSDGNEVEAPVISDDAASRGGGRRRAADGARPTVSSVALDIERGAAATPALAGFATGRDASSCEDRIDTDTAAQGDSRATSLARVGVVNAGGGSSAGAAAADPAAQSLLTDAIDYFELRLTGLSAPDERTLPGRTDFAPGFTPD